MKRLLPDTQMLMWLCDDPAALPKAAARLLENEANVVYFSMVSVWETAIKFALGRPEFTMHPRGLRDALLGNGFVETPIHPEHVIAVARLPLIHRDPFDRLIVAQAEIEQLELLTTDRTLARYGSFVRHF